jgi:hypothetical protein
MSRYLSNRSGPFMRLLANLNEKVNTNIFGLSTVLHNMDADLYTAAKHN